LAEAQAAHRSNADFAHPYYWSAMTLYGDDGVLTLSPAKNKGWLLGDGLAVLLVLGGWFFFNARTKQ
jgi:hypothetical protein